MNTVEQRKNLAEITSIFKQRAQFSHRSGTSAGVEKITDISQEQQDKLSRFLTSYSSDVFAPYLMTSDTLQHLDYFRILSNSTKVFSFQPGTLLSRSYYDGVYIILKGSVIESTDKQVLTSNSLSPSPLKFTSPNNNNIGGSSLTSRAAHNPKKVNVNSKQTKENETTKSKMKGGVGNGGMMNTHKISRIVGMVVGMNRLNNFSSSKNNSAAETPDGPASTNNSANLLMPHQNNLANNNNNNNNNSYFLNKPNDDTTSLADLLDTPLREKFNAADMESLDTPLSTLQRRTLLESKNSLEIKNNNLQSKHSLQQQNEMNPLSAAGSAFLPQTPIIPQGTENEQISSTPLRLAKVTSMFATTASSEQLQPTNSIRLKGIAENLFKLGGGNRQFQNDRVVTRTLFAGDSIDLTDKNTYDKYFYEMSQTNNQARNSIPNNNNNNNNNERDNSFHKPASNNTISSGNRNSQSQNNLGVPLTPEQSQIICLYVSKKAMLRAMKEQLEQLRFKTHVLEKVFNEVPANKIMRLAYQAFSRVVAKNHFVYSIADSNPFDLFLVRSGEVQLVFNPVESPPKPVVVVKTKQRTSLYKNPKDQFVDSQKRSSLRLEEEQSHVRTLSDDLQELCLKQLGKSYGSAIPSGSRRTSRVKGVHGTTTAAIAAVNPTQNGAETTTGVPGVTTTTTTNPVGGNNGMNQNWSVLSTIGAEEVFGIEEIISGGLERSMGARVKSQKAEFFVISEENIRQFLSTEADSVKAWLKQKQHFFNQQRDLHCKMKKHAEATKRALLASGAARKRATIAMQQQFQEAVARLMTEEEGEEEQAAATGKSESQKQYQYHPSSASSMTQLLSTKSVDQIHHQNQQQQQPGAQQQQQMQQHWQPQWSASSLHPSQLQQKQQQIKQQQQQQHAFSSSQRPSTAIGITHLNAGFKEQSQSQQQQQPQSHQKNGEVKIQGSKRSSLHGVGSTNPAGKMSEYMMSNNYHTTAGSTKSTSRISFNLSNIQPPPLLQPQPPSTVNHASTAGSAANLMGTITNLAAASKIRSIIKGQGGNNEFIHQNGSQSARHFYLGHSHQSFESSIMLGMTPTAASFSAHMHAAGIAIQDVGSHVIVPQQQQQRDLSSSTNVAITGAATDRTSVRSGSRNRESYSLYQQSSSMQLQQQQSHSSSQKYISKKKQMNRTIENELNQQQCEYVSNTPRTIGGSSSSTQNRVDLEEIKRVLKENRKIVRAKLNQQQKQFSSSQQSQESVQSEEADENYHTSRPSRIAQPIFDELKSENLTRAYKLIAQRKGPQRNNEEIKRGKAAAGNGGDYYSNGDGSSASAAGLSGFSPGRSKQIDRSNSNLNSGAAATAANSNNSGTNSVDRYRSLINKLHQAQAQAATQGGGSESSRSGSKNKQNNGVQTCLSSSQLLSIPLTPRAIASSSDNLRNNHVNGNAVATTTLSNNNNNNNISNSNTVANIHMERKRLASKRNDLYFPSRIERFYQQKVITNLTNSLERQAQAARKGPVMLTMTAAANSNPTFIKYSQQIASNRQLQSQQQPETIMKNTMVQVGTPKSLNIHQKSSICGSASSGSIYALTSREAFECS